MSYQDQHSKRPLAQAVKRAMRARCPNCGRGTLFNGYLTVNARCDDCGLEMHHHRADDAPPYFTIFAVGHILVPLALAIEVAYRPSLWIHALIWPLLTVILCVILLRPIKGAIIGLQWALGMHGFSPEKAHQGEGTYMRSEIHESRNGTE